MTHGQPAYRIRPARSSDFGPVMSLLDDATVWLKEKGLDQWQANADRRMTHVETDIGGGTLHVVEKVCSVVATITVATITVDGFADADFWKPADDVTSGLYAHRMAVARPEAGKGLGSAMLDWAGTGALACRRKVLRLDAWVMNRALCTYYKNLGFTHVRTALVRNRGSGALFERPATVRLGIGPTLVAAQA